MGLRVTDLLILAVSIFVVGAVAANQTGRSAPPWLRRLRSGWDHPPRPRITQPPLPQELLPRAPSPRSEGRAQPLTLTFTRWHALAALAFILAIYVWMSERNRPNNDGRADIVLAWLLSMGALVLAVWRPAGTLPAQARTWIGNHRLDLGIAAGLTVFAAFAIFVRLGSHPWTFNGDEGQFALSANAILDGAPVNPFGTGLFSHANAYFYAEAAAMALFGETVAGARMISATFGVLAIPVTYALVSRLFDRPTGVMAAVLLGSFHVHIYWSRNALNNGASTFFVVLTLLLVCLALHRRTMLPFLLTGMTLGFAQYAFLGNRILPVTVACILLFDAGRYLTGPSRSSAALLRKGAEAFMVTVGAIAAMLPHLAFYASHPELLNARHRQVSIFGTGWLDAQRDAGRSLVTIFLDQLRTAALTPFSIDINVGHYRGDAPFIGWPMAVPVLIGLVIATVRFHQKVFLPFAVAYWVTIVALVTVAPPMQTNRFVPTTPLFCIFAAIAISAVAYTAQQRLRLPPRAALIGMIAATALISIWSLNYFFSDSNQVAIYSDPNTQVAEHLARDILDIDPSATVYFAAPPRMWYDGFANLVFRTPDATGVSLDEPLTMDSPRLEPGSTTIFAFLPERSAEVAVVRSWYPNGVLVERASDKVGPLYTLYIVRSG